MTQRGVPRTCDLGRFSRKAKGRGCFLLARRLASESARARRAAPFAPGRRGGGGGKGGAGGEKGGEKPRAPGPGEGGGTTPEGVEFCARY